MPSSRRNSTNVVDARHALDLATNQIYEENVFLFVPNLIGYARIVMAVLALYFMSSNPTYCTLFYGTSCLLDAMDGYAARALGQSSKFGAVLDMVIDRKAHCTTTGLLCYLCAAYPQWALGFQLLIALDFSSHYMHMYSSLVTGSQSHKSVRSDVSSILWYYYNNRTVLFILCTGNELFFVSLYLMKWDKTLLGDYTFHLPTSLDSFTFAEVLFRTTAILCMAKNAINVLQLWKASQILVGIDLAERAMNRKLDIRAQRARRN